MGNGVNKVKPAVEASSSSDLACNSTSSLVQSSGTPENSTVSSKDLNESEKTSNILLDETCYLKLKPFNGLDPTLVRLLGFLKCFGLTMNSEPDFVRPIKGGGGGHSGGGSGYSKYLKMAITLFVVIITSEVVYDVNLRQSKLLAEQKRSTPLLTFVIVAYYWLALLIPLACDLCLIFIGPYLFRFYSRTTATVCNGLFFGKKTSIDTWYYYLGLVLFAFLDVVGQVVLLGVWPQSIDPYMRMVVSQDAHRVAPLPSGSLELPPTAEVATNGTNQIAPSGWSANATDTRYSRALGGDADDVIPQQQQFQALQQLQTTGPRITTYLLDFILGERHAHSDLGVCIKIACLMIQFMHSYAFLVIIISLAAHYANVINNINENLDDYEFRRLSKQLIILRDSSEQISMLISLPLAFIILLVFMRQIALNGVFIQSTMQPYENWAVSLQTFTCSLSIFMVFIYCDSLQSASRQTHRLKIEQTMINENRGGNQSIYEFLDYLDRLSKTIRITFFNMIVINKISLVGLFGHVMTLTFVTS